MSKVMNANSFYSKLRWDETTMPQKRAYPKDDKPERKFRHAELKPFYRVVNTQSRAGLHYTKLVKNF